MKCRISRELLDRFAAEARAAGPHEACGLLLGDEGRISGAIAMPNVAQDAARGFAFDPAAHILAARRARSAGDRIVGHYHSHPSGIAAPSDIDAAQADEQGRYWLIVAADRSMLWLSRVGGAVLGSFDPVDIEIV